MPWKWVATLTLVLALIPFGVVADPNSLEDAALARQAGAMLTASMAANAPGASALIARGDQVIFRTARGSANLELGVPLQPQHVFRIGSITKTFTAAAILKLSAEGKLSLNDPLAKFLPDFPNGMHITLAELLDHTAGISDAWESTDPAQPLDTTALVKLIAGHAPDFAPGTAWAYSNSGYMLLGAVIEKIRGQPWYAAIDDLFAKPLKLTHTAYHADDAVVPQRVTGYSRNDRGDIVQPPYINISGPGAAGALASTVDDLFHWMRALVTGRALPPGLFEAMSSAKTTATGDPVHYGYGLMLGTVRGESVIEHTGGIEGFAAQLSYFPKQHVTVVVLANTDAGSPNPRSLAHQLGALAIGNPYIELKAIHADESRLRELCGNYRIDATSTRTISLENGMLTVRRDNGPKRVLALAQGELLFFPGDGTDYFKIARDDRGRVIGLDFHADGMPPARREIFMP